MRRPQLEALPDDDQVLVVADLPAREILESNEEYVRWLQGQYIERVLTPAFEERLLACTTRGQLLDLWEPRAWELAQIGSTVDLARTYLRMRWDQICFGPKVMRIAPGDAYGLYLDRLALTVGRLVITQKRLAEGTRKRYTRRDLREEWARPGSGPPVGEHQLVDVTKMPPPIPRTPKPQPASLGARRYWSTSTAAQDHSRRRDSLAAPAHLRPVTTVPTAGRVAPSVVQPTKPEAVQQPCLKTLIKPRTIATQADYLQTRQRLAEAESRLSQHLDQLRSRGASNQEIEQQRLKHGVLIDCYRADIGAYEKRYERTLTGRAAAAGGPADDGLPPR